MSPLTKPSPQITSVTDLLKEVSNFMDPDVHHRHLRLWSRGQRDSSWALTPGVYRKNFPAADEIKRLKLENHLTQDFKALPGALLNGNESQAELYYIQQHFGMPTRLLDWSTNPLVSLWFAVCNLEGKDSSGTLKDKDGLLAMMDVYQLYPDQKVKNSDGSNKEGISSNRDPMFMKALRPIFEWRTPSDFPHYILPIRPDYSNQRFGLQRSCFTFHVPEHPELTTKENSTLKKFIIPAGCKADIKNELALSGIDHFSIYGDLEALSKSSSIPIK